MPFSAASQKALAKAAGDVPPDTDSTDSLEDPGDGGETVDRLKAAYAAMQENDFSTADSRMQAYIRKINQAERDAESGE
jgi:TolA-binding protein